MSVTLPENIRQTLAAVLDCASNGAAVDDHHADETDGFKLGYQQGSLELVVDVVGSVLENPHLSRHEHMTVHWAAADQRRAERKAEVAP